MHISHTAALHWTNRSHTGDIMREIAVSTNYIHESKIEVPFNRDFWRKFLFNYFKKTTNRWAGEIGWYELSLNFTKISTILGYILNYEHKKAVKYNNFFFNFVSSKDKMEFFEIAITESDTLYTCINRSLRSHSCAWNEKSVFLTNSSCQMMNNSYW